MRILFNAHAGFAEQALPEIRAFSDRLGIPLHTARTPDDVDRLTRAIAAGKPNRIIVAGGDGTVSGVVNALAPDFGDIELAIVPLGTGNDLARSLGAPLDDVPAALELAASGKAVAIDVIRISNGSVSWAVNAISAGFGADVTAELTRNDKRAWGAFAYWLTALTRVIDLREHRVTLDLDGRRVEHNILGLAISNGRYVGGGFAIAPDAALDDGLLDVTVIPANPLLELLAAGLDLVLGRNTLAEGIATHRARRVHISFPEEMRFSIDGNLQDGTESTFEAVPQALRMVAGEEPALADRY
jgi:YegS/Rv2252/BmrU family lipid kinase